MPKPAPPISPPPRLAPHPRSGWVSFLLFQVVMLLFCVVLVLAVGNVLPGLFPDTEAGHKAALHLGIYVSLPVAVAGVVLGIVALLQETHRRLLGVIGTALNGGHVMLCLVVLSRA